MTKRALYTFAIFLALCLGGVSWLGITYPKPIQPEAIIIPAPTPVQFGYQVAPGWAMTPTPGSVFAVAVATPTSVWLQPSEIGGCDMADAIARDAASHTCEALWAAERDDPHVQKALQIEPAIQVTRKHDYGRYTYMLFSQALIVWRNVGDDGRIAVLSPHGCWRGLPETLQPPSR